MLKNYLTVTLRSLLKRKFFVFINLIGIGLAVAFCIVAYLNWDFRARWDEDQVNANTIYRIQFWQDINDDQVRHGVTPIALAAHIRENIQDVKEVTRFAASHDAIRIGNEVFNPYTYYADPNFFDVFSVHLLHGDLNSFKDKSRIFISDELAKVYFNREDVVGEQITQLNNNVPREFIVGGVFKSWLSNSSFNYEAITLIDNFQGAGDERQQNSDWRTWVTTFVQIEEGHDLSSVQKQLEAYVKPQNLARPGFKVNEFYLQPLRGMANDNSQKPALNSNEMRRTTPYAVVILPSVLAILLLLLACFNFTNTSIALSGQRLKEIGIRKVMGGFRKQLIIQFLSENILLCILGFLLGLVIAEFLVPAYDELWPWLQLTLSYKDNIGMLLFLFGLLVLIGMLAGAYPAFYITSFHPIAILRDRARLGGTSWLTRILLGFQLSISLVTIVFGVGFYKNASYQKEFDLGLFSNDVISVYVGDENTFNTYRDAVDSSKNVIAVAGTRNHLSMHSDNVKYQSLEGQVDVMDVGEDYVKTAGVQIIAGRDFIKSSATDRNESVLVSEEFVKRFGIENPLGKRLVYRDSINCYIIGITRDIYVRGFFKAVEPVMLFCIPPARYTQFVARTKAGHEKEASAFMKRAWQQLYPNIGYNEYRVEDNFNATHETNENAITIFSFLGFFSVLMSATGLFALVSVTIMRRVKEIGIRKILGASIQSIMGVISFEFFIILSLAVLTGGGLGYFGVNATLQSGWEYFESVNVTTLIVSGLLLIVLSCSAVAIRIFWAAKVNPVESLRAE